MIGPIYSHTQYTEWKLLLFFPLLPFICNVLVNKWSLFLSQRQTILCAHISITPINAFMVLAVWRSRASAVHIAQP